MPVRDKPYFMSNKEWYVFNEEKWKYELTDEAPQEAIDSYNDFYKKKIVIDEEGNESEVNPDIGEEGADDDDDFYGDDDDDDNERQAMNLFGLQGGQNNGMQQ